MLREGLNLSILRGYFPAGPHPPLGSQPSPPYATPSSIHVVDQRLVWHFPTVRHLGYVPLGRKGPVDVVPSQLEEVFSNPALTLWSFLAGSPTHVQIPPSSWKLSPHKQIMDGCYTPDQGTGPHWTGQSPAATQGSQRWTSHSTCGKSSKPGQGS